MTPLPMPVDLPIWALATVKMTRAQTRELLGEPHFVETDPRRTCGGERDAWAYRLPSGQRLLVIVDVISECAELCGDSTGLGAILEGLGIRGDDPRLIHHEPVALMR